MKAVAEVQVIPIGVGATVRNEVKRAHDVLADSGLDVQLHAYGTNAEGDLDTIFSAIKKVHETLHEGGAPRLATTVKIETRTDKIPTLEGKLLATR